MGISFSNLENEPPNVQSKLLQLAAAELVDLKERQEIILKGSYLPSINAREGLAKGLQSEFYDGLQDITLAWFDVEGSVRVKELLAEHFSRFGNKCKPYEDKVLELLESDPSLKELILLGAEGTALFGKLKMNDPREGTRDLFADDLDPITAELSGQKTLKSKSVLMLMSCPKDEKTLSLDHEVRDLK